MKAEMNMWDNPKNKWILRTRLTYNRSRMNGEESGLDYVKNLIWK